MIDGLLNYVLASTTFSACTWCFVPHCVPAGVFVGDFGAHIDESLLLLKAHSPFLSMVSEDMARMVQEATRTCVL